MFYNLSQNIIETITKICFSYHSDSFKIDSPSPQVNVEAQMCPRLNNDAGEGFFSLVSIVL